MFLDCFSGKKRKSKGRSNEAWKHLKALMHKNLIYWRRSFIVSAFEIVIPCILLVIMILIR
jgi:hypothetical protein